MPPVPRTTAAVRAEALLRELPQLRRGHVPREAPGRWPSGLASLDRLLGGGFPRGRLSEITGPASSGRTSLALALLAATTDAGEYAAVVDAIDAFDPASAAAARVDLERTLWVRARDCREGLLAAHVILKGGGFGLVLLDLSFSSASSGAGSHAACASWLRLARAATASQTAVVVVSDARVAGGQADVVLELRAGRPQFSGRPPLLEGLESQATAVRNRSGPIGGSTALRFQLPP